MNMNDHLDFSAEDIECFLGGVLSRHHHPHDIAPHDIAPHDPHDPLGHRTGEEECDTQTEDGGEGSACAAADDGTSHRSRNRNPTNIRCISEEQKAAVRTERKRCREKQRRSDVNRQFAELSAALRKVEAESTDWARHTYTSTTNRADLIARSIYILNAIHESNEARKRRITELERDLEQAKKAGEETAAKLKEQIMAPQQMGGGRMVMMVPMMIGGDASAPTPSTMACGQMPYFIPSQPAAADATTAMPLHQYPYMMQHMMAVAAQQHQQTIMQSAGVPMGVLATAVAGAGPVTGTELPTGDIAKKKAAVCPPEDYTNNVAHLA